MKRKIKKENRYRRHKRVRAKVFGTADVPRLCVFRSAKHIYGQLIDDEKGRTLVNESDLELKKSKVKSKKQKEKKEEISKTAKVAIAYQVGKLIAEKALRNKIKEVVFDRGGYKYHGRVRALAEGAREGGLIF